MLENNCCARCRKCGEVFSSFKPCLCTVKDKIKELYPKNEETTKTEKEVKPAEKE
jgi:hypothetical protein